MIFDNWRRRKKWRFDNDNVCELTIRRKGKSWDRVYDEARATLRNADSVLATVDEAVAWTNKLIERIVAS